MNLVVVGNYKEYWNYLMENKLNLEKYKYVANFENLLGYETVTLFYVGRWHMRKDIDMIQGVVGSMYNKLSIKEGN